MGGLILKKLIFVSVFSLICSQAFAQRVSVKNGRYTEQSSYSKQANSGLGLRSIRRAGVSLVAAGDLGTGGAKLELNLTPTWSFSTGFGGSTDFSAFSFQVTRYLSGTNFLPYVAMGLTRWYGNANGEISTTSPSILADELMNDGDRRDGKIREFLLTPKLGLQYLAPNGEYAGYGFFAEVMLFLDIQDLVMAPTGSVGVSYYF